MTIQPCTSGHCYQAHPLLIVNLDVVLLPNSIGKSNKTTINPSYNSNVDMRIENVLEELCKLKPQRDFES